MTIALMPAMNFKENSGVPAALHKSSADGSCSTGVGNNGNAVAVISAHEQFAPTNIVNTACPPMNKQIKIISSSSADDRMEVLAVLSDMVATTAGLLGGHAGKEASLLGREHVSMVGVECDTMKIECSADGSRDHKHKRARHGGVLYSSEGCTNQARAEGVCVRHGDQKINEGAVPKRKKGVSDGDDEDGASSQKKAAHQNLADEPWPLTNILTPGSNDCLIGSGRTGYGSSGNRKYLYLVERKEKHYRNANHLSDATVATEIVNEWRAMSPPGRFLEQDKDSMLWNDVGDDLAKKKVVGAFRYEKRKRKDSLNKIPTGPMKKALKKVVPLPPSYPPPGYFIHHEWPKLDCFNEEMKAVLI